MPDLNDALNALEAKVNDYDTELDPDKTRHAIRTLIAIVRRTRAALPELLPAELLQDVLHIVINQDTGESAEFLTPSDARVWMLEQIGEAMIEGRTPPAYSVTHGGIGKTYRAQK